MGWSSFAQILRLQKRITVVIIWTRFLIEGGQILPSGPFCPPRYPIRAPSTLRSAKMCGIQGGVTARHTHSSHLDGAWCSILMMQHYNWSGEGATLWLLGVVDWATDGEQKLSHKELSIIQWETPLTNAQFFTTRIYSASQNPFRLSNTCTSHYKGEPHLCWWWNFVYRTCY